MKVLNKKIINYQINKSENLEKVSQLADNAMLKVRSELWVEWDFEKNNELGLDIWKMTSGSDRKVWWVCPKCNGSYDTTIKVRATFNCNCPYCSGRRVNHTNSLASLNPELARQWHPTLNGELTPHDVTCSSGKKVWWLGECGHEWATVIASRNKGVGCIYCCNQKTLKGFNDMWTTNPELAKLLHNTEDGYKYTQMSNQKVDWKCLYCGELVKNKTIHNIKRRGLSCPSCSDGFSHPERFIYNLLKYLKIEFVNQPTNKDLSWITSYRYDFYIPCLNLIIETHGEQHFIDKQRRGARTLEEEQLNDRLKKELAMLNEIKYYVELDCQDSNDEYIINSILHSKLNDLLSVGNVNWNEVSVASEISLVVQTWQLWNSGIHNTLELATTLSLNRSTVIDYLHRGNRLGKCVYDGNIGRELYIKTIRKPVVQLSMNNKYIKSWNSINLAHKTLSIKDSSISACCNGRCKQAGGYKWMFKVDYDKYIEDELAVLNSKIMNQSFGSGH